MENDQSETPRGKGIAHGAVVSFVALVYSQAITLIVGVLVARVKFVAIGAFHQALFHFVVKRHRELRPLLLMAPIAKLRLRFHQ